MQPGRLRHGLYAEQEIGRHQDCLERELDGSLVRIAPTACAVEQSQELRLLAIFDRSAKRTRHESAEQPRRRDPGCEDRLSRLTTEQPEMRGEPGGLRGGSLLIDIKRHQAQRRAVVPHHEGKLVLAAADSDRLLARGRFGSRPAELDPTRYRSVHWISATGFASGDGDRIQALTT